MICNEAGPRASQSAVPGDLWGISQAKDWLSVKKNREGNFLTVAGRASDAIAADMAKSPSNFLRDGVSTAMVVAFAPLSAILLIL